MCQVLDQFFSPSLKISRLKIVFDNVGQRDRDEIGRKWESKDDEDLSDAAAAYLHTFSAVRLKRLTEQAKTTALAGAGQQASW